MKMLFARLESHALLLWCWTVIVMLNIGDSTSMTWIPDAITIGTSNNFSFPAFPYDDMNVTTSIYGTQISSISVESNGMIYMKDGGHFQLLVTVDTLKYGLLNSTSECITVGANSNVVSSIIASTIFEAVHGMHGQSSVEFTDILDISTRKYFSEKNGLVTTTYQISVSPLRSDMGNEVLYIYTQISRSNCAPLRTISSWSNPLRWTGGVLPSSHDNVVLPMGTGVIQLEESVTLSSLYMTAGLIIAHVTGCPDGWSVTPTGATGSKCYKLFENITSFDSAENTCANSGRGSIDAHLVQISNYDELSIVKRLCRGNSRDSMARLHGCWIGLHFDPISDDFKWLQPKTVQYTGFRDWRRAEPNNHTFSEGQSTPGELCTEIVPWQGDPLIQEEGSMNDDGCALSKAFVCQLYAPTRRYSLTVTASVSLLGGGLEGGSIISLGSSDTGSFFIRRSGQLKLLSAFGFNSLVSDVALRDGSMLILASRLTAEASLTLGESAAAATTYAFSLTNPPNDAGIMPLIQLASKSALTVGSITCTTSPCDKITLTLDAYTTIQGNVTVGIDSNLAIGQGADLAQANVYVVAEKSTLSLVGDSSRMSSYDAFDLAVSHRGLVTGIQEDAGNPPTAGVYRLQISDRWGNKPNITQCIPYHASTAVLKAMLDELPLVSERGGVTVRRYGNGSDWSFIYGYTYRIEMDAVPTAFFAYAPLDLTVQCEGPAAYCGCAQTVVPLMDATGQPLCSTVSGISHISRTSASSCVIPPNITTSRISTLSYIRLTGHGSLQLSNGVHRLPPICSVTITSSFGNGIVAADIISWHSMESTGRGALTLAGTGWNGWDNAIMLFLPAWADGRGMVKELNSAAPFNMHANEGTVSGLGALYTVCPNSNMTFGTFTWAGGILGGRAHLYITDRMLATGTNKALWYGLTLFIDASATLEWRRGNISLSNGADIIIEGNFIINTTDGRQFIGEAQLLSVPSGDVNAYSLLAMQPATQWHGYFDDHLPTELRGGWYQNPLCGDQCLVTNQILVREMGAVMCLPHSDVTFSVPLNLLGSSVFTMSENSYINLASGGICGNQVVMDISNATTMEFSGGNMLMRATCTISGQGELLVSAGEHDLGNSVNAHITIAGGYLMWPLSRGVGGEINFFGGLLMKNRGILQVQPFSTTINIHKEVQLRDDCMIQFPDIGTAAQPSTFDEPDAPDRSPHGNFIVNFPSVMKFAGGTLRGKAYFIASYQLFLYGGTKTILSLAKLINRGHCEWSSGDLITSTGGDVINEGTFQMAEGVNMFSGQNLIQGVILPVESGGDVFALNFHSWDQDSGSLSYVEYVHEREQFVSRLPPGFDISAEPGWTPADGTGHQ